MGALGLTTNTTPSPYVASASSELPESGAPNAAGLAFNVFSADPNKGWAGVFGAGTYVQIDLGSSNERLLTSYTIRIETFDALLFSNRALRDWTIEGSNDLLTWDLLDTQTGQTWISFGNPALPSFRIYQIASPITRYRYFRINITAITGVDTYAVLSKWEFGGGNYGARLEP